MANAVTSTPLPVETDSSVDSKPSHGPPPPPKRSERPSNPAATNTAPTSPGETATTSNERRAEYVPAPPRMPVELPKIPKLDVPPAAQHGAQRISAPPPVVATSALPARSNSVSPSSPELRSARTTPPARYRSTQPGARSAGAFAQVGESLRAKLPAAVKERIEGVPAVGLIVGAGALTLMLLAAAGLTARTAYRAVQDAPEETTAAGTAVTVLGQPAGLASETRAESTKTADTDPKPPTAGDEATVLLDLGNQLLTQRKDAEVVPLLARLIAREPARANDPRVRDILLAAAASDDRKAAADSHALLTGAMGEAGATLVYELSLKGGVRDAIRARAQAWLASKDFERIAPLPVFAAQKLRAAKTCEDKQGLLDFAQRAGGKHVLEYLKELDRKKSCAPDDLEHCYPCMRNDNRLSDAIASLEKK
jgi:hypothetical protein